MADGVEANEVTDGACADARTARRDRCGVADRTAVGPMVRKPCPTCGQPVDGTHRSWCPGFDGTVDWINEPPAVLDLHDKFLVVTHAA